MMADFDKLRDFAAAFDGHVFRSKDGKPFHQLKRSAQRDPVFLRLFPV